MEENTQEQTTVKVKRRKHGPTMKQRRVFEKVVKKGVPVSVAMVEEGYSPKTANNPDKITQSDGWLDLLDKYLPEETLAQVHEEGLQATKVDRYTGTTPDYGTRHAYLSTAYKIRGRLKEDGIAMGIVVVPVIIQPKNDPSTPTESNPAP